jgi:hypothetical protein
VKYLSVCVLLLLGIFQSTQHRHTKFKQQVKTVIYCWNRDTLNSAFAGKRYLRMRYKSAEDAYCHLAFRVFLLHKNQSIPSSIQSDAYLGTYALSMSCEGIFMVPIPKRYETNKGLLIFTIVPLNRIAKPVNVNIQKNFSFSVVVR